MTKGDLRTLVRKIQNECGLEAPSKITYFWDRSEGEEPGTLVFKIFFDSLDVPRDLLVDEENINNMFTVKPVYEYEDDFTIRRFDTDHGYLEVVPEDQNFKIINSYKDAYQDDDQVQIEKREESLIRLAGKRISESFAKSKGYILAEADNRLHEDDGDDNSSLITTSGEPLQERNMAFFVTSIPWMTLKNKANLKDFMKSIITEFSAQHENKDSGGYIPKLYVSMHPKMDLLFKTFIDDVGDYMQKVAGSPDAGLHFAELKPSEQEKAASELSKVVCLDSAAVSIKGNFKGIEVDDDTDHYPEIRKLGEKLYEDAASEFSDMKALVKPFLDEYDEIMTNLKNAGNTKTLEETLDSSAWEEATKKKESLKGRKALILALGQLLFESREKVNDLDAPAVAERKKEQEKHWQEAKQASKENLKPWNHITSTKKGHEAVSASDANSDSKDAEDAERASDKTGIEGKKVSHAIKDKPLEVLTSSYPDEFLTYLCYKSDKSVNAFNAIDHYLNDGAEEN